METYLLIVTAALFLGVIGIIAMLERRRRIDQAHFEQLHQVLGGCLAALQEANASSRDQSIQLNYALGRLQATVEANANSTTELNYALGRLQATVEANANSTTESRRSATADTNRAVQTAADYLQTVIVQHQKAMDATFVRTAEQLFASVSAQSKELIWAAQHTTKAIEELRTSLEESVKELRTSLEESVKFDGRA